jgi:hypothetical protein
MYAGVDRGRARREFGRDRRKTACGVPHRRAQIGRFTHDARFACAVQSYCPAANVIDDMPRARGHAVAKIRADARVDLVDVDAPLCPIDMRENFLHSCVDKVYDHFGQSSRVRLGSQKGADLPACNRRCSAAPMANP